MKPSQPELELQRFLSAHSPVRSKAAMARQVRKCLMSSLVLCILIVPMLAFTGLTGGGVVQAHRVTSVQREALPILTAVHLSGTSYHFLAMFAPCLGLGMGFIGAMLRRTRQKSKPAPGTPPTDPEPLLLEAASDMKLLVPEASEERRIVLLGKTGQGKSTVGNRLHDLHDEEDGEEEVFKTSFGTSSETKGIQSSARRHIAQRNFMPWILKIIDTEGFIDTDKKNLFDKMMGDPTGHGKLEAMLQEVNKIKEVWEEMPEGVHTFVYVTQCQRFGKLDGELAKGVTKYLFDGAKGTPNLIVLMTFCNPRLLKMDDAEKKKWLENESSKNENFKAVYELVGRNPSQFVFVDNIRNMKTVYQKLREKILGIQVPLKWKNADLWSQLKDLIKERKRVEKEQQEKAAADSAQKVAELAELKRQLEEKEEETKKMLAARVENDARNDSDGCFGGMCQVLVKDKGTIRMHELGCGDLVQTGQGWSRVVGWWHRCSSSLVNMVEIVTSSGTVVLTPNHFLFLPDGRAIAAGSLRPGDHLASGSGSCTVMDVRNIQTEGYYAPLTESGTLQVAGVMASCYTEVCILGVEVPHQVLNFIMWPVRSVAAWLPQSWSQQASKKAMLV